MPHWEISIALEHKGEVVDGVVFDAAKDEMFYAEKGQGAWLNGSQRLRVSGRAKMSDAVYATGLPFGPRPYLPAAQQDLARLLPQCSGVRRWGVASLDLAYVAAGRYEGYWERGVKVWDIAAGLILVREAGGFVEPVLQGASIFESGGIIAGNNALFDAFRETIRERSAA